jgi:hypothetical protein
VSYWDEATGGEGSCACSGLGGEGVRGDTQRVAQRLLARLMGNLLATHDATELAGREASRRRRLAPRAVLCCGFPAIDRRSQYC